MTRLNVTLRLVIGALVLAATLGSSSCVETPGVGVGMDSPARWGGGNGPPVYVGGPSF